MRNLKSLFIALILTGGNVIAQEKPTLSNIGNENPNQAEFKFDNEEFDFGSIVQGESVTHEFEFVNTGSEPLVITNAEGSCGCTVPIYSKEPIMKGKSGVIKVTFNSTGKSGIQDKTVTLTSNARRNPLVLHMKGTVTKVEITPSSDKTNNESSK